MSEIKSIILVTGEELIGTLKHKIEISDVYLFEKPRVVAIMRSPDGRQGLGLVPWAKSNMDATIEINKSQTVSRPFDPVTEVTNAYLQETSGIQLASSLPPGNSGGIIQQ